MKVTQKYKEKTYSYDANYSAKIIIADIKKGGEVKMGDILRVIHLGKQKPNRVHFERLPINEKVRLLEITKYKKDLDNLGKKYYVGMEHFYLDLNTAISLIRKAFNNQEFTSRQLTHWVFWCQDFNISKYMDSIGVDEFIKRFSTWQFCKILKEKGILKSREEIINPIPDNLGRIKKRIYYILNDVLIAHEGNERIGMSTFGDDFSYKKFFE